MSELETLRKDIDLIDKKMVELFEARMEKVSRISNYKLENQIEVLDRGREDEVLDKNIGYLKDKSLGTYLKDFYIKLMGLSKDYQKDKMDSKERVLPKEHISGSTKLTCIIGNPVDHSRSPYMHNLSFESLNLDYIYTAFNIEKGCLEKAMEAIRTLDIKGFNVTMPYKEEVMEYLDEIQEDARLIGSVNTVLNQGGRLIGYNTDGRGFVRALEKRSIEYRGKKIVILGAGGASRAISIELALQRAGEIVILNRSLGKAEEIAKTIGGAIGEGRARAGKIDGHLLKKELGDAHILINATSLGMGVLEGKSIVKDPHSFHRDLFVADLIYSPGQTKFLKMAKEAGCKTMNGMDMLIYQGDIAFKIWTGYDMPKDIIDIMRRDLLEDSRS